MKAKRNQAKTGGGKSTNLNRQNSTRLRKLTADLKTAAANRFIEAVTNEAVESYLNMLDDGGKVKNISLSCGTLA